jgi:TRAP-type C4-dicarboxylate transport system substrate-binding protein
MSNKAWKSLSESQQEAVYRSMRRWMDFDTQNASRLYKGFEKAVKDSGGTLYHLTKEQNEEFRKVREPLWEKIMPIAGAEGKELVEAVKTMR